MGWILTCFVAQLLKLLQTLSGVPTVLAALMEAGMADTLSAVRVASGAMDPDDAAEVTALVANLSTTA